MGEANLFEENLENNHNIAAELSLKELNATREEFKGNIEESE